MDRRMLEDITILDLTWVIAGPMATRLFCDLGASVIKVESRKSFDILRTGCQRKGDLDSRKEGGFAYNELNPGKTDITINLKSEKGRAAFEDLVLISDVVVCNFGVGAFRKLKLTYDDLKEINPKIIVLNASGLGNWGPYSSFVSFAPILQSLTGIHSLVGYENASEPFGSYPPIADYMGALAACNYLMAALECKRKTGEGQFIDLSQGEAAVSYLGPLLLDWQANRMERGLKGNHHYADSAAPHNIYRCAGEDKWCAISVVSEEEWLIFSKTIDPDNEWTGNEKFSTRKRRIENQKELDNFVGRWTRGKAPGEVGEILQDAGVSGVPVQNDTDILYHDIHLKERCFFKKVVFPPSDKYPESLIITGLPIRIDDRIASNNIEPAPEMGKHTEFVMTSILGKSKEWFDSAEKEDAFV